MGTGRTLAHLNARGYDAEGITPDAHQIATARSLFGEDLPAHAASFEGFTADRPYDAILFQESSQYVDSGRLFAECRDLAASGARVVVLDEFATRSVDRTGALHRLDHFLAAAREYGFRPQEDVDLSHRAAPTVTYFLERLSRRRGEIVEALGVSAQQIDALITSGEVYRELYQSGAYVYRLLRFWA